MFIPFSILFCFLQETSCPFIPLIHTNDARKQIDILVVIVDIIVLILCGSLIKIMRFYENMSIRLSQDHQETSLLCGT